MWLDILVTHVVFLSQLLLMISRYSNHIAYCCDGGFAVTRPVILLEAHMFAFFHNVSQLHRSFASRHFFFYCSSQMETQICIISGLTKQLIYHTFSSIPGVISSLWYHLTSSYSNIKPTLWCLVLNFYQVFWH